MDKVRQIYTCVFFTLLFDLLAFALILPLLPRILDYYAENDKSFCFQFYNQTVKKIQILLNVPQSHNQVLLAGILGSWFSLLQFLTSPLVGALSDKYGRKPLLVITTSGTLLSYLVWYSAQQNFALFVLARTLGGLSRSNVGIFLAIISDVSTEKTRGKGMATIGIAFSLAFIFGPIIGASLSTAIGGKGLLMADSLISWPASIAISLSFISLFMVIFSIEETNTVEKRQLAERTNKPCITHSILHYVNPSSLLNFKLLLEVKEETNEKKILKNSAIICFTYLLFFSGLEFTLSFLTHIKFAFTPMQQGRLYLFSGLLMATLQGGYIRRAKNSGKEVNMLLVGLGVIVPSFIVMGVANNIFQLYCSLTLFAASSAIAIPCLSTIVSLNSPSKSQGVAMGTFRSIGSLARAIGPCLASAIFFTFGPNLCYIFGGLALVYPFKKMVELSRFINDCKNDANNNGFSHVTNLNSDGCKKQIGSWS